MDVGLYGQYGARIVQDCSNHRLYELTDQLLKAAVMRKRLHVLAALRPGEALHHHPWTAEQWRHLEQSCHHDDVVRVFVRRAI